jgi:hypothetical protein
MKEARGRRVGFDMRRFLLAVFAFAAPGLALAQEFTSPLDVVSTLYGTYFLNVPMRDITPYFSDDLTERLGGTIVGHEQFRHAGFDPLTGRLDWAPRGFKLSLLNQAQNTAQVRADFQDGSNAISVTYDLVREEPHGWQIDHIAGKAGDLTWCSNSILSMATP